MSLGQIILYHNLGIEQKYGKVKSRKPKKASEMDYDELKKLRDKLRSEYGDIGEDD